MCYTFWCVSWGEDDLKSGGTTKKDKYLVNSDAVSHPEHEATAGQTVSNTNKNLLICFLYSQVLGNVSRPQLIPGRCQALLAEASQCVKQLRPLLGCRPVLRPTIYFAGLRWTAGHAVSATRSPAWLVPAACPPPPTPRRLAAGAVTSHVTAASWSGLFEDA